MTTDTTKPRTLEEIKDACDAPCACEGGDERFDQSDCVDCLGRLIDEAHALGAASRASPEEGRAVEALRKIAALDREIDVEEDDGDATCAECHTAFQTLDGLDPAPECHACSTKLLAEARHAARGALAGTVRERDEAREQRDAAIDELRGLRVVAADRADQIDRTRERANELSASLTFRITKFEEQ